jgi:hypothetical protein
VLRLIKEESLKYTTLVYRLKLRPDGQLKPLPEVPHLLEAIKKNDIARLHESSWMENTMEFAEGTARTIELDRVGDAQ